MCVLSCSMVKAGLRIGMAWMVKRRGARRRADYRRAGMLAPALILAGAVPGCSAASTVLAGVLLLTLPNWYARATAQPSRRWLASECHPAFRTIRAGRTLPGRPSHLRRRSWLEYMPIPTPYVYTRLYRAVRIRSGKYEVINHERYGKTCCRGRRLRRRGGIGLSVV